jgi:hypothetical protein
MNQRISHTKVYVLIMLVLASLACSLQKNAGSSSDTNNTSKGNSVGKEKTQVKLLTAKEILDKSTQAMKNVKSMSLQLTITSGGAGVSIEINGEGVVEQPDKAYIKMDFAGQTIEMLMLSKTEAYMKQPGSTDWEPVPADQLSQPGGMNVDVIQQLGIVGFANELNLDGSEILGGVDCYHITFSLDIAKYLAQLGEAGSQIDATTSTGTGDLWIGKDDFLMRKFLFNFDAMTQGVTVNASTLMTMSKFNQPVEIPSP